jgi:uncharacterized membrane protein (UPF0127 family)
MSKIAKVIFNKTELVLLLQVADTDILREHGLMNVKYLDDKSGMLFIFNDNYNLSFWMYRTYIPLTVLFINSRMKIVDIQSMESCFEENRNMCNKYISREPAKYAIEVNKGFHQKYAINIGDYITIDNIYYS